MAFYIILEGQVFNYNKNPLNRVIQELRGLILHVNRINLQNRLMILSPSFTLKPRRPYDPKK